MIHGDLSPYNILYWEGEITLIDFPQVTNSQNNPQADFILRRDIERVCEYFQKQGVKCNANAIFTNFWEKYVTKNLEYVIADHWVDDDPLDDDDDFDDYDDEKYRD
jgi:serine/threonine-protein kinase RIO1